MRLYIPTDYPGNAWPVWSKQTRSPMLQPWRIFRGSTLPLSVSFVTAGQVVSDSVASGAMTFSLKQYAVDGSLLITQVTSTKTGTGTGTGTVHSLYPSFLGNNLDTLLGTDPSVSVIGELNWTDTSTTPSTLGVAQFSAVVIQNANRGGESSPVVQVTGSRVYLSSLTRLTGGVAETDLDAVATATVAIGVLFEVVVDGVLSMWRVEAGTAATDTVNGIIRPTDYNVSTNAKNLVRVIGN